MRVQATAPGFHAGVFRDIGDVFDIPDGVWTADSSITADSSLTVDATLFSGAAASIVPAGNPVYPLPGWMTQVPANTPLVSYALGNRGASSQVVATVGTNSAGQRVYGQQPGRGNPYVV